MISFNSSRDMRAELFRRENSFNRKVLLLYCVKYFVFRKAIFSAYKSTRDIEFLFSRDNVKKFLKKPFLIVFYRMPINSVFSGDFLVLNLSKNYSCYFKLSL